MKTHYNLDVSLRTDHNCEDGEFISEINFWTSSIKEVKSRNITLASKTDADRKVSIANAVKTLFQELQT
jgi:hypothetical protein